MTRRPLLSRPRSSNSGSSNLGSSNSGSSNLGSSNLGSSGSGSAGLGSTLLSPADPPPVEVVKENSTAPVVLVCEHAGRRVPERLNDLGISPGDLASHRGWDIGAEGVARQLADSLDAPLVLQNYSRLVIDSNRPPISPDAILPKSDGLLIPANQNLSHQERQQRIAEIFEPMDRVLTDLFERCARTACFSVHSFTPQLKGESRPWHVGLLSRTDLATAHALKENLSALRPDLEIAVNQPYQIDDDSDWFIPVHAERRNLSHALIEIRNDQLATAQDEAEWGLLLATAIRHVLEDHLWP